MNTSGKAHIINKLQEDILRLQGYKPHQQNCGDLGLGPIVNAFPNQTFPLGAVHEFISSGLECSATTNAFLTAIISNLVGGNGTALWISGSKMIFPPSLRTFGVRPEQIIFLDIRKESEIIWAIEESLKCGALKAVVGELRELSFKASRRFQLAVEESHVTGFIHHKTSRKLGTTACVSRWRITSRSSESIEGLPGVGFPSWRVELLRVRNGKTGIWNVKWIGERFVPVFNAEIHAQQHLVKAG